MSQTRVTPQRKRYRLEFRGGSLALTMKEVATSIVLLNIAEVRLL